MFFEQRQTTARLVVMLAQMAKATGTTGQQRRQFSKGGRIMIGAIVSGVISVLAGLFLASVKSRGADSMVEI